MGIGRVLVPVMMLEMASIEAPSFPPSRFVSLPNLLTSS